MTFKPTNTHQLRTVLLIRKWTGMISDEGYILRSISSHVHFGSNLHTASISA
jgi:hypothetical protein